MGKSGISFLVLLFCVCQYSHCYRKLDDQEVLELHRRFKRKVAECDKTTLYRNPDGTCNNLVNPKWGSAGQPFERLLAAEYGDGHASPSGEKLPSARVISTTVHPPLVVPDVFSVWLMQWGQFITHDITLTPTPRSGVPCCTREKVSTDAPCFPIRVPSNDPYFRQKYKKECLDFVRSVPVPNSDPREQFNGITSFIDASVVYGSSKSELDSLRSHFNGLLLSSDNRLPKDPLNRCILNKCNSTYCFKAGDVRVNAWAGLATIQTIFMRQHNLIANELKQLDGSWSDEELFQTSRRIVEAINAHITYYEYLPLILGPDLISKYDLDEDNSEYDITINPTVFNSFAAAAFHFGHSQIPDKFCGQNLETSYLRPDFVIKEGVTKAANCLSEELGQKYGTHPTDAVTNHFCEIIPGVSEDLIARTIQRGRDHGLPSYNDFREHVCKLNRITSFKDPGLGYFGEELSAVYDHVDDMELYPPGTSEPSVPDGIVGETFGCIIGKTFSNLKKGDRFFYERTFTPEQLTEIRKITLARVICDTTSTFQIQPNVFRMIDDSNKKIDCSKIPKIDYSKWAE